MGAIAGILRWDGLPASADAEAMIASMSSRAPDGSRTWADGNVGLGHGALHTTPEAASERLPLTQRERLAITADARLDNRTELLRELHLEAATGDGELILAGYERWGEDCVERLLGDFSFVIWDRERQRLFCACDRFAVKGLVWHRSERLGAVGTEIKALLAVAGVPRRFNEVHFVDFLCLQVEDPVSTIYLEVQRLPAAHTLTLDRDGARLRRYWELDPRRCIDLASDAEYEEAFREAFTEAVRVRLRRSGPLAATLSGGIDSTSVVVVARELLRTEDALPLDTISARFSAVPGTDEGQYIEAVLETGDLRPRLVYPEQYGLMEDWAGAPWRGDEPEPNPQVSITRALYTRVAETGANITLEGFGGDFVASHGAERLTELAASGRWIKLVREARALAKADFAPATGGLLKTFAISPFVPRRVSRLRGGAARSWTNGMPIDPELARRLGLAERYAAPAQQRDPRAAQLQQLTSALIPLSLSILGRIAAGLGVEPRHPFLDSRLVEFCLAVPPSQKLRRGYTRDLLRRGLSDKLPATVRWRTGKARPGDYVAAALPARSRELVDQVLHERPQLLSPYVELSRLHDQYRRCLEGAGGDEWFPVFRAVVGGLWLERERDQQLERVA